MITPTAAVMIVFGVIALIGGYSLFRSMLPLWGFILGGWLAFSFLPVVIHTPQAKTAIFQAIAFIAGGIVGAAVAIPLYFVIVFLSGAALGGLAGVMIGAIIDVGGFNSVRQIMRFTEMAFPPIPQTSTQFIMLAVFGLILGAAAINFQKFMVIASSSFLGSAALVSGLIGPITQIGASDMNRAATMLTTWLVLGILGMIIQFRWIGET
ncbi:MAG: DUF4203 domain-containing protein [Anaerolineaceae bacterium]|nr:DUF4203 domain-containing protein [Anaerolineaceae bacterium]